MDNRVSVQRLLLLLSKLRVCGGDCDAWIYYIEQESQWEWEQHRLAEEFHQREMEEAYKNY